MFSTHTKFQRVVFSVFCSVCIIFFASSSGVKAQEIGAAQSLEIAGDPPDGSIISNRGGIYVPSAEPYDNSIIGIVVTHPAIEIKTLDAEQGSSTGSPVISQGIALLRVNTENGPISAGDTITSSSTNGVGMRADKSGFIVGISQESFAGDAEGLIPVSLTIKFAFGNDSASKEKVSSTSLLTTPFTALRYVLAAAVILAAFGVAVFTVAKVSRDGVIAIGRNPMASKAITMSIVTNTFFSICILGIGCVAAYTILKI